LLDAFEPLLLMEASFHGNRRESSGASAASCEQRGSKRPLCRWAGLIRSWSTLMAAIVLPLIRVAHTDHNASR